MSAAASGRPGGRLRLHLGIQIVLVLLYFLPGGLLWNRVEPLVLGLPFSVFVTAVALPVLFVLNMVFYVVGHWGEDGLVTTEVRRREAVPSPFRPPSAAGSRPDASGGGSAGEEA